MNSTRAKLLLLSMLLTFILVRLWLYFYPNTDFYIGSYNIHHLFVGIVLIVLGGIPAILFIHNNKLNEFAVCVFGIGLALTLDEFIYLIVSAGKGSNKEYWLSYSYWGAIIVVTLTLVYIAILNVANPSSPNETAEQEESNIQKSTSTQSDSE